MCLHRPRQDPRLFLLNLGSAFSVGQIPPVILHNDAQQPSFVQDISHPQLATLFSAVSSKLSFSRMIGPSLQQRSLQQTTSSVSKVLPYEKRFPLALVPGATRASFTYIPESPSEPYYPPPTMAPTKEAKVSDYPMLPKNARVDPKSATILEPAPASPDKAMIETNLELVPLAALGPNIYTNARPLWQPAGARGIYGGSVCFYSRSLEIVC
jgi:hypothetical protein